MGFSETIYHSIEVEADSAEEIEDDVYEFLDTNYPNWLDDTDKDSVDFNFDVIIEDGDYYKLTTRFKPDNIKLISFQANI